MAEKKLAKKKITWTEELKQILLRCSVAVEDEAKINKIPNKGLRIFEVFKSEVQKSDTITDENKERVANAKHNAITTQLSKLKALSYSGKSFKWTDEAVLTLLEIYNQDKNIDSYSAQFKLQYPNFKGANYTLQKKIERELKKLQELEKAAKQLSPEEIFNRVDWNSTEHNYKGVLNECAFDVSLEFKASVQRNLSWTREQIYQRTAELFHRKFPDQGTYSSIRRMIERMNLFTYHRFFDTPEPIDINSEEYKASASNMPTDLLRLDLFMQLGQNMIEEPLFNALCFKCGQLLWGNVGHGHKFKFPAHVDPRDIPLRKLYDVLTLPYYDQENDIYYCCRNCFKFPDHDFAKIFPVFDTKQAENDGYEYSKIEVPRVVAALQSDVERGEVALCGLWPQILQQKEYYRGKYISVFGQMRSSHKNDESLYRMYNYMASYEPYDKTKAKPESLARIESALKWLHKNNDLYKEFYAHYETLFRFQRRYGNPVELYGIRELMGESKKKVLEKIMGGEKVVLFVPAFNERADDEEMVLDQSKNIAGICHPKTIEKKQYMKTAFDYVQMTWCTYNDFALECKLFPHLYPYGKGSYIPGNRLTLMDFTEMRLLNRDDRWRQDKYYSFFQLNRILMDHITGYNKYTVKTANPEAVHVKTVGDLQRDQEEPIEKQLGLRLPPRLPGSRNMWREKRSNLRAMCNRLGKPHLFITLTQNDASPDLQAIVRQEDPGAQATPHHHLTQPIKRSGRPVVDVPVESILRMNRYLLEFKRLFIYNKKNNPFGDVFGYFIRAEYQKRGAVHYHILLWSHGGYDPASVVTAEVPRGEDDHAKRMRALVLKFQIHSCGPVCRKERLLKNRKRQDKDTHICRNGFPFHICNEEYNDLEGRRIFYIRRREEDRRVVPYNMELLAFAQAHINVQKINDYMLLEYLTKYVSKPEPLANVRVPAKAGAVQRYLNRRIVGQCEAAAILLQIPQCMQSHEVIYLPTELKPKTRVIKRSKHLPKDVTSTDIYYDTKFEKYLSRPETHEFENLTYVEFYENYRYFSEKSTRVEPTHEDQATDSEEDGDDFEYKPEDDIKFRPKGRTQGKLPVYEDLRKRPFRQRSKTAIARWQFFFMYGENQLKWCIQQLMLHVPWREDMKDAFFTEDKTTVDYMSEIIQRGLLTKSKEEGYKLLQSAIAAGLRIEEIEEYADRLHIEGFFDEASRDEFITILREESAIKDFNFAEEEEEDDLEEMPVRKQVKPLNEYLEGFTESQRLAFEYFRSSIESKRQLLLCITGEAGTGKSFLLNAMVAYLQEQHGGMRYELLATTGCAAVNIQGRTTYNFLKMNTKGETSITWNTVEADIVLDTKAIFVDEISMMSSEHFILFKHYLERFANIEDRHRNSTFGGRHMVFFGDFAQLPAIGQQLYRNPEFSINFEFIKLKEIKRQENVEFKRYLSNIRLANYTEEVLAFLRSRSEKYQNCATIDQQVQAIIADKNGSTDPKDFEDVLILTSLVAQKKEYNSKLLAHIIGDIYQPKYHKDGEIDGLYAEDVPAGGGVCSEYDIKFIEEHFNNAYPKKLEIKLGAKVMLLKNINTSTGWVNGTLAIVRRISESYILIEKLSHRGECLDVYPETQLLEKYGRAFQRKQFPLELAYAITIHKSQGMTITTDIYVNLTGHFKFEQPYVALSRCTTLDNLHIFNLPNEFRKIFPLTKQLLDYIERVDLISPKRDPHEKFPLNLLDKDLQKRIPLFERLPYIPPPDIEEKDALVDDLDMEGLHIKDTVQTEANSGDSVTMDYSSDSDTEIYCDSQTTEVYSLSEGEQEGESLSSTHDKRQTSDQEIGKPPQKKTRSLPEPGIVIVEEINNINSSRYARQSEQYLTAMIENRAFESEAELVKYWEDNNISTFATKLVAYLQRFPERIYSSEPRDHCSIQDFVLNLYVPVFTPADGDCFYHSISLALCGSSILTSAIRFAVVAKIIENRADLKNTALRTLSEMKAVNADRHAGYSCSLEDLAFSASLMPKLRVGRSDVSIFPRDLFSKANLTSGVIRTFHYACQFHMFIASMVLNRPIMNYGLYLDRAQRISWSIGCTSRPPVSMFHILNLQHFVCLLPIGEDTKTKATYSNLVSFLDPSETVRFNARQPEEIPELEKPGQFGGMFDCF